MVPLVCSFPNECLVLLLRRTLTAHLNHVGGETLPSLGLLRWNGPSLTLLYQALWLPQFSSLFYLIFIYNILLLQECCVVGRIMWRCQIPYAARLPMESLKHTLKRTTPCQWKAATLNLFQRADDAVMELDRILWNMFVLTRFRLQWRWR